MPPWWAEQIGKSYQKSLSSYWSQMWLLPLAIILPSIALLSLQHPPLYKIKYFKTDSGWWDVRVPVSVAVNCWSVNYANLMDRTAGHGWDDGAGRFTFFCCSQRVPDTIILHAEIDWLPFEKRHIKICSVWMCTRVGAGFHFLGPQTGKICRCQCLVVVGKTTNAIPILYLACLQI